MKPAITHQIERGTKLSRGIPRKAIIAITYY